MCSGLSSSSLAMLITQIYRDLKQCLLIVLPTERQAETLADDIAFFQGDQSLPVCLFPPNPALPSDFMAYQNKNAARRIRVLYDLIASNTPPIVITTAEGISQYIVPKQTLADYAELIIQGEDINRDRLVKRLVAGGYSHALIVEEPGDFCVRGGILDVFSTLYDYPLRLEWFGETVDSMRFFSHKTQRTIQAVTEATIVPARESIVYAENETRLIHQIRQQATLLGVSVTKIRTLVDQIKEEKNFSTLDGLMSFVYDEMNTLFDYMDRNALCIMVSPSSLEREASDAFYHAEQNFLTAKEEKRLCVSPEKIMQPWDDVYQKILAQHHVQVHQIQTATLKESEDPMPFSIHDNLELKNQLKEQQDKEHLLKPLVDWITLQKSHQCLSLLICRSQTQARRLESLLKPYGIPFHMTQSIPDVSRNRGLVYICLGQISSGFVWHDAGLAIASEDEIFGPKRRRRKATQSKVQTELLSFQDLNKDDLVVHIEHGIGQYQGLVKLRLNAIENDFILILYKDDDRLYLPVDRLNMIQKYMGVEGVEPTLEKMGGKNWEKIKSKVKKSAEKMAKELLDLYAARKVDEGFAFSPDDSLYQDFEAKFEYEETPDQLKSIEQVLNDMEQQTPMDRLICGDVGYGKTEVALRASFKAVNDGKQVALLVPTTLLCEQHLETFHRRFENYPVRVEGLSRFKTAKQQRQIIQDLSEGRVDIIIGTHRLLQKDIQFKDIGLLIIDEEQRFGVRHKERIKRFRKTLDVLALTATPIPRTLHMSMLGIRDISVISTPPEARHPITTFVTEFDGVVIAQGIRKELARQGQIFFVHNNINTIYSIASHVQKLVPELRLAVAHGRMSESELESVMLDFIKQKIDMLVCTTIIESGIDIPSANTIFINRAERFGLSQIYQLRGRVGRSGEEAFAYLFIPPENQLKKNAQKRMKVLMEYSDLGEGFQLAMSDLQIRGGGAILGAEQSGHIAAVGYEMFLELVERAVQEQKGKAVLPPLDPEINVPWSVFIPESYIPDIDQRLIIYRRLSRMTHIPQIADLQKELIDRFGKIPTEVKNLLSKMLIKVLAKQAGLKRVDFGNGRVTVYCHRAYQKNPHALADWVMASPEKFQLLPDDGVVIKLNPDSGERVQAKNILKEIGRRVNNLNLN
ncbi:MAG: transcription-repair coupling factor [Candidatus Magnetomorum sp.]|nr:transcription-repair coupling factor [Candidatus Magnetomorum sp.]